jgi:hypothetical protein
MDTTDSEISFSVDGTCSHCKIAVGQLAIYRKRLIQDPKRFDRLIHDVREKPGREGFEAIIGVSGGVDSSYLLHVLSQQKLRLLAVHVDAGWNSIEAVKNINSIVSSLNIPLETVVIDWNEMQSLQLSFLKSGVMNQDVPQDHAFFASLYRVAENYGIRHVISGSNYATESILPRSWGQHAMDGKQVLAISKKFSSHELKSFPILFLRNHYLKTYFLRKYKVHAPLNFFSYSRREAIQTLSGQYGWIDYGGKHKESKFTDYFQEVYLPARFGIEKKRAHLSSLIVNSEISRDEAMTELRDEQQITLEKHQLREFVATKLGITTDELMSFEMAPFVDASIFPNEKYLTDTLTALARLRNFIRESVG